MITLKKYKPKNEKELHSIIEEELDALEEELNLLKYEFDMGRGRPDFLCVDSGGRLVIIEVKLEEDDNILFQALRYYTDIDKERYVIAKMFKETEVDPSEHPRILLIAGKFSDYIRRLSTLVVPDVELFEYTVLSTPEEKQGVCYHAVTLPKIDDIPTKPKSITELKNYIKKDALKPHFDKIMKEIENIGEGIEKYATQGYVGFKYKGRQIAWLWPLRKSFDLGSIVVDSDGHVLENDSVRIETGAESYNDIYDKIKESFGNIVKREPQKNT